MKDQTNAGEDQESQNCRCRDAIQHTRRQDDNRRMKDESAERVIRQKLRQHSLPIDDYKEAVAHGNADKRLP